MSSEYQPRGGARLRELPRPHSLPSLCWRRMALGPTRTLPSGAEMPVLGLGVWQMSEGAETEQAIEWALEAGYRLIDTAAMYRNEKSVGAAVRRSGIPRAEIFVT